MKSINFIVILLFATTVDAQVKIDAKVKSEYDSLFKIQPKQVQLASIAKQRYHGFALIKKWTVDTLNLDQYKPLALDTSTSKIVISKTSKKEEPELDTLHFSRWLSCAGIIRDDSLFISTNFGPFESSFGTLTKILSDYSKTVFVRRAQAEIYKKNLVDKKSKSISLGTTSQNIVLSNLPKKAGNVLYGKVTIETEPFYEDCASGFKNGYIYKKYAITFLFYCNVTKRW